MMSFTPSFFKIRYRSGVEFPCTVEKKDKRTETFWARVILLERGIIGVFYHLSDVTTFLSLF